jgi:pimeloyl-ACP methyl ester carboxylesterase
MPSLEVRGTPVSFLDQGSGEPVLLLHGSASCSAQWRPFADALSGRYRVLAPDLYGCGSSGGWCKGAFSLAHEAEIAGALLQWAGERVHLVGHSYGGAVALQMALRWPASIRSLALLEPAAFHLLRDGDRADAEALAELTGAAGELVSACARGEREQGMAIFVDYWNGAGTWAAMPAAKKGALASRLDRVVLDFYATFEDPMRLRDCRPLGAPVLVMQGDASPLPARRICARLVRALSGARLATVQGAGHMLPMTHPDRVNALLASHLDAASAAPKLKDAA